MTLLQLIVVLMRPTLTNSASIAKSSAKLRVSVILSFKAFVALGDCMIALM